MTQRVVTYFYAVGNFAFLFSTLLAGVASAQSSYLTCAALMSVGLGCLVMAFGDLRDALEDASDLRVRPLTVRERLRVRGYSVLCVFTLIFATVYFQFIGGALLVFLHERAGLLGHFKVPETWYLSFSGLVNLLAGPSLLWAYLRAGDAKFYTKFRIAFFCLACASGIITVVSRARPHGGVSPYWGILAVVFITLAEQHYNPIMMAAISTELPRSLVGISNGVHFLLFGFGGLFAGVGVSMYKVYGPTLFFGVLCSLSLTALLGLQLLVPFLEMSFEADSESECLPLNPGGRKESCIVEPARPANAEVPAVVV